MSRTTVDVDRAAEHKKNANMPARSVLTLMAVEMPGIWERAYVVGRWVWVSFDAAPPRKVCDDLYRLGFRFNRKRQVWQHPGGVHSGASPNDPRFKYGRIPATELVEEAEKAPGPAVV